MIAQVINQNMDLSIDEKKVSIKSAKRKIDSGYSGHQVASVLNRIFRSNSFKNLEKYRNCSTHRRQIYIRAETVVIEETPGYSTTGEITSVKRLLCDDPLALTPSVSQQRELVAYCENIFSRVCSDLIDISNNL